MNDPTHTPHYVNLALRIPPHVWFVPLGGLAALPIGIGPTPPTKRSNPLRSVPQEPNNDNS